VDEIRSAYLWSSREADVTGLVLMCMHAKKKKDKKNDAIHM
jgi:hypothetical protein